MRRRDLLKVGFGAAAALAASRIGGAAAANTLVVAPSGDLVVVDPACRAPVEIVPRTVVPGVLSTPEGIGRQRHQAAQAADQFVCPSRSEERAVAAIMLNNENADEKSRRQHRYWQCDPKRNSQAQVHCGAAGDKPAKRVHELSKAAPISVSGTPWFQQASGPFAALPHPPPAEVNPPTDRLTHRYRPAAAGTDIALVCGRRGEFARSKITVDDLVVGVAGHATADCTLRTEGCLKADMRQEDDRNAAVRFAADSWLERAEFEPSVPRGGRRRLYIFGSGEVE